MSIRAAVMAILAASTAPAGAQPGKDQQPVKAPPSATPSPVALASASDVRRPLTRATEPARRPAPRVTTCRCGDPQLTQDQQAEEQPDR